MHWVDILFAQRKGLQFYQTRSNATILHDTLPAYCISKVVVRRSEEIVYQKVYVSPRPPPKISYEDNWMCDLDSDVAGSSKDTQRIQPKPKTHLSSTGRMWARVHKGNRETYYVCLVKKNMRMSQTQQVRGDPYVDQNPQSVAC